MKIIILILAIALCVYSVNAGTTNVTSFDDGSGKDSNLIFKTGVNSYTKTISIPINSTVTNGIIDFIGSSHDDWQIQENANLTKVTSDINELNYVYMNYTKPNGVTNASVWQVKYGSTMDLSPWTAYFTNITIDQTCWDFDINLNFRFKRYRDAAAPSVTSYVIPECQNSSGWFNISTLSTYYGSGSVTGSQGTSPMFDGDYNTFVVANYVGSPFNTYKFYNGCIQTGCYYQRIFEEGMWWYYDTSFPHNVTLQINGTTIFNHTGNMSSTNMSINFTDELQTCVNLYSSCEFVFSSDTTGNLNIQNLSVTHNKTNTAVLTITSPSEITASITTGNDYDANLIINNSGDWNASVVYFETISEIGTPNYNSSITHNCTTIENNTAVSCMVTFNDLMQNPEPDEKIRLVSIGSDENATILSNSIDVDITVSEAVTGGGGGGQTGTSGKCSIDVLIPRNKLIGFLGQYGYETDNKGFSIRNNKSISQVVQFSTVGLNCKLLYNTITIPGESVSKNYIQCNYPVEHDEGYISISSSDCDTKINVILDSNWLGEILIYLTGGAGPGIMLLAWVVFVIISGAVIFLLIELSKIV